MIALTRTRSKGGQNHMLAVQCMCSHKLYTVGLGVSNTSAVATAFRIILGEARVTPELRNTNMGAEFTSGACPRLLDATGVEHRLNYPRHTNTLATLGQAIQTLNVSLM